MEKGNLTTQGSFTLRNGESEAILRQENRDFYVYDQITACLHIDGED